MPQTDDQIEFQVQMLSNESKNSVTETLKKVKNLQIVSISVPDKSLVLELGKDCGYSSVDIQNLLEKETGLTTVLRGFGNKVSTVSELFGNNGEIGVVRLSQLSNRRCLVDGVIDGVSGKNSLNIHEYGDLSGGNFENLGNIFVSLSKLLPIESNTATFRFEADSCELNSCIGRSLAITNLSSNKPVAAGVVARASKVSGNTKKICACSGKTLWEERKEHKKAE